MSNLAKSLESVEPVIVERVKKGPTALCSGVYPAEDLEDWAEVQRLRTSTTWLSAQRIVDQHLGITKNIPNDKFRYHWRRRCQCWPDELRLT
jgi:hypothetical protein